MNIGGEDRSLIILNDPGILLTFSEDQEHNNHRIKCAAFQCKRAYWDTPTFADNLRVTFRADRFARHELRYTASEQSLVSHGDNTWEGLLIFHRPPFLG